LRRQLNRHRQEVSIFQICRFANLSTEWQTGKWRLIPYQTEDVSGTMLRVPSHIDVPEVRLPLRQNGWYSVHLGIWNPHLMYDGKSIIKARLSSVEYSSRFIPVAVRTIRGRLSTGE
jgi:hypothetical protein